MVDLRINEAISERELTELRQINDNLLPLLRRWRRLYNQLALQTQETATPQTMLAIASLRA